MCWRFQFNSHTFSLWTHFNFNFLKSTKCICINMHWTIFWLPLKKLFLRLSFTIFLLDLPLKMNTTSFLGTRDSIFWTQLKKKLCATAFIVLGYWISMSRTLLLLFLWTNFSKEFRFFFFWQNANFLSEWIFFALKSMNFSCIMNQEQKKNIEDYCALLILWFRLKPWGFVSFFEDGCFRIWLICYLKLDCFKKIISIANLNNKNFCKVVK